ncbi:acyl-CoA dehydrogenase family protein [Deferrisoma palaeochoriense]
MQPNDHDAPLLAGGAFLLEHRDAAETFTPEDFTAEQRMMARTARTFMENEVLPVSDQLEGKDLDLLRRLLRKAGELGLLMADVPEDYGGLGLDKATSALIAENLSGQASFQITALVQTGIGSLPLVYYGTEAQKRRYLPGLADGSLLGCYALTEPTAGSDALAIRTRAVPSPDGRSYRLTGTKQFVTNARIADVLTVFAKVDGRHFTAFLVDRDAPGLTFGPDERKMGLHGATTCGVHLDEVVVPAENVLGEVGRGHKIAFNILNIGRFKLGAVAVGAAKRALEQALAYALERRQFGRRIAAFGAIREKLGEMYARIWAAEAAVYRTVGLIDALVARAGHGRGEGGLRSIEEYAIECALVKVLGTETLDFVADETVQCLGGYGYCAEYPVEAYYRDSRINRIYEGTNEINRILAPTLLKRRAGAGELPLERRIAEVRAALGRGGLPGPGMAEGPLVGGRRLVQGLKALALLVLGAGWDAGDQAVDLRIADLALLALQAESAVLRAEKAVRANGEARAAIPLAAARLTVEQAVRRAASLAEETLVHLGDREALARLPGVLRRDPADTLALREEIAGWLVERERVDL